MHEKNFTKFDTFFLPPGQSLSLFWSLSYWSLMRPFSCSSLCKIHCNSAYYPKIIMKVLSCFILNLLLMLIVRKFHSKCNLQLPFSLRLSPSFIVFKTLLEVLITLFLSYSLKAASISTLLSLLPDLREAETISFLLM